MFQQPYEIMIPTHIFFEPDASKKLGTILGTRGYRRAVICTDGGVSDQGILARIEDALRGRDIEYVVYQGSKENPGIQHVIDARDAVAGFRCDCVVGVGGGGPIDVAKALSVALTHEGDIRDYVAYTSGQRKPVTDSVLPVIAVPTVAGAGAEVSPVAVIVDELIQVKVGFFSEKLFPEVAVVDPTLAVTLPPRATAGSGMDVFAHAFDALVSRRGNPFSDALATSAIETVFRFLPRAVHHGDDIEARGALASASIMGLMAIYLGKGGAVHTIGEPLGTHYDIPHGYACAVALPVMMEYLRPVCGDMLARIYRLSGNLVTPDASRDQTAGACIEEVVRLIDELELPRLSTIVPDPEIEKLADASIEHLAVDRIPTAITRDDYKELYRRIFS